MPTFRPKSTDMRSRSFFLSALVSASALSAAIAVTSGFSRDRAAPVGDAQVDRLFARWSASTPGCAVGAAVGGKPQLAKGYGMADLEHDIEITPDTIFEAGSVSKQFTAAAMLLLARDGKLSLDDQARKYLPELPDYGSPLTIRHMLNHTSGLRDWGSVEAIAGWPRTTRAYTQAHVLDIVSRQRALNFAPGTRWSYSNTGYNLAAIIIARVSGMPFADFTRQRLFQPLGMTHTSWRDDHTRVVKQRAIAYDDRKDGFHTDMPFEDVHGNGGLLTTVGDLLTWNEHFDSPRADDAPLVALQQQAGSFNDGRTHGYGLGLMLGSRRGVRVVEHSGSTAGYSAHLLRYPEPRISVAVLCNVNSARATQAAHDVADLLLGDRAKAPAAGQPRQPPRSDGFVYRHAETGVLLTEARAGGASELSADGNGRIRVTDQYGTVDTYERVPAAKPAGAELSELAGTYASDEAEATLVARVEEGSLVLKRRPDSTIRLTPIYRDAFNAPGVGLVIFRRDGAGRVTALSVNQDRVWDLRFTRSER